MPNKIVASISRPLRNLMTINLAAETSTTVWRYCTFATSAPKPLNDAQNWVVYFYPSMSIQFDTNVVRIIPIINGMASWFMHNTSNISMEITDTSRIVITCIISTKNTIFILHLTPKNQLFTVLYSSILYIWIFTV